MDVRVEIGAERLDRRDAALAQQVEQLPVDQLDARAVARERGGRIGCRRRGERALEVVDERQHVLQQLGRGVLGQLAALAIDALAVVVELGRRAQQPVAVIVAFLR